MKTCRLQVGSGNDIQLIVSDINLFREKSPVQIINGWDEENEDNNMPSTLKDISLVMWGMVGCGVTWQLAGELSKRLNLENPRLVSDTLFDIFREYVELSDDEAFARREASPKFPG